MERITKKLIKNFLLIITLVVTVCFIGASMFLSKYNTKHQYSNLKNNAEEIYSLLKEGVSYNKIPINGIILKDGRTVILGQGKMGVMYFIKYMNSEEILQSGKFKNPMNEKFIYYKYSTDLGDIIVLHNNKDTKEYMRVVYIILISVFLLAVLISIPLMSYVGKKFTKPILKLQKSASYIAEGNFNVDMNVETGDEIEDLSHSLQVMTSSLYKKHTMQREFIANVSHDFKTPLSVIRSHGEAIYDGLVTDEMLKEYCSEIIKEVDRINLMVIEILQLSKLQGGEFKLNKEYFNLKIFLEATVAGFLSTASEKKIKINLNIVNVEIFADEMNLLRVVRNFIDNAIKFSNEDSEIDIVAVKEDEGVKVSIIDYGIGIEEEFQKNIWNRYYKNTKSGGMGLGLAICSEILKLHGFDYGVYSVPNEKTEFYFNIKKHSKLQE